MANIFKTLFKKDFEMKLLILFFIFIAFNVHAQDYTPRENQFKSVTTCFKGVHFNKTYMAVGTSYRSITINNSVTNKEDNLQFDYEILDFHFYNNKLYILSKEKIEIYDPENSIYQEALQLTNRGNSWPQSLFIKDEIFS